MDNPIGRIVEPVARVAAVLCGYAVLILSFLIVAEILLRKLFASSLQGIDDIGGYVLAIAAAIGASYTMAMRGHTRVDVFLVRMPVALQRVLNTVSLLSLAGFAAFAFWRGISVLRESIEFQSAATNPLQTPLWQPQLAWVIGLGLFALIALAYGLHALYLLATGGASLNRLYGPATAQDELEAELTARAERAAQQAQRQSP